MIKIKYIRKLLLPLSYLYAFITKIRNLLYDKNILNAKELPVPVISIGNITVGGTGKTPFCIAVANFLDEKGLKIGIVSRGYKRKSTGQVIVSTGEKPLVDPGEAGDEPYLIARKTKAVVISNSNRYKAGQTAINDFGCDVLLLDDGFQHRLMDRDLDIVLWDQQYSPRQENLLPAGDLRENITSLKRADSIVFTRTDSLPEEQSNYFAELNPELKQFTSNLEIDQIYGLNREEIIAKEKLKSKSLLAFCALGNPDQFIDTVQKLSPGKLSHTTFPDHYKYTEKDRENLQQKSKNFDYLITTEKDWANLPENCTFKQNLLILTIKFNLTSNLKSFLLKKIRSMGDI